MDIPDIDGFLNAGVDVTFVRLCDVLHSSFEICCGLQSRSTLRAVSA